MSPSFEILSSKVVRAHALVFSAHISFRVASSSAIYFLNSFLTNKYICYFHFCMYKTEFSISPDVKDLL